MKHIIYILILFIISLSLVLVNTDVFANIGLQKVDFIQTKHGLHVQMSSKTFIQEFSSKYHVNLYCQFQNNLQDTTKNNADKVLFGRSRLKNHFEIHGKKFTINEKKRNKWIHNAVNKLRNDNNSNEFQPLVMNVLIHEEFYQASYRLIDGGMINFDDGSYLKLISTSTHSISEIGDITLAVDEHGNIYINQGHICGGIIHFKTHQKEIAKTSAYFLKNFLSDTDDEPWVLYKLEKQDKTNK